MVLGLLDQLQIFWQLYLIELLGFLTGLGLQVLLHMLYPRLSTEFGMLVFFTNVSVMEFQVRYLALFFFLGNRRLRVVLDGVSSQEYPVNAGVPLMTFPMILSVTLLSMLMILLFTLSVIRHRLCGNN